MIWLLLLGIFLYLGFLAVLLPWNTVCYYAGPLGVFFALIVSILISDNLLKIGFGKYISIVLFAFAFNLLVCQYALVRESTYQYDTYNFCLWFKCNYSLLFKQQGFVGTNAMEPAEALPKFLKKNWGIEVPRFYWDVGLKNNNYKLYVYSPRFSSVDLSKFSGWKIVFLSKNWVVYKKGRL